MSMKMLNQIRALENRCDELEAMVDVLARLHFADLRTNEGKALETALKARLPAEMFETPEEPAA